MQALLNIETLKNHILVHLPGEFDGFLVDKVREQLDGLVHEQHQDVVLDLSSTRFIDSSGIGAIVFLYKRLKGQKRALFLNDVEGQPLKLMYMLHVDRTIPVNAAAGRNV